MRQRISKEPIETTVITHRGVRITIPTQAEILRIKGALILKRNATRDYLDFVALTDLMGQEAADALVGFDALYPQDSGESAPQQLQVQLADF